MFKIGEFSKLSQVSIRMLRYYDEVGLLKPAVIDEISGYRLYSIEQFQDIAKIVFLRDLKFSTKDILMLIDKDNKQDIVNQLDSHKQKLREEIINQLKLIDQIDLAIHDVNQDKLHIDYNITFKSIHSYPVLSLRGIVENYYHEGELWDKLGKFISKHKVEVTNDMEVSLYHNDEFDCDGVDIEICVSVKHMEEDHNEFHYKILEGFDKVACIMVYGPYRNIASVYYEFATWLEAHPQYEMYGISRQISHKGVHNSDDSQQYITEIQIPVKIK